MALARYIVSWVRWLGCDRRKALPKATAALVLARTGYHCLYCPTPIPSLIEQPKRLGVWEVDHYEPRKFGGSDGLKNLVAACFSCNRKKGDSSPSEKGSKWSRCLTLVSVIPGAQPTNAVRQQYCGLQDCTIHKKMHKGWFF